MPKSRGLLSELGLPRRGYHPAHPIPWGGVTAHCWSGMIKLIITSSNSKYNTFYVYVRICMMYIEVKSDSGIYLNLSPPCFLRKGFSLNL